MGLELKDFCINKITFSRSKVTRSGTGISEKSVCYPCYQVMQRKFHNVNYTPSKSSVSKCEISSLETASVSVDNEPDKCMVCGKVQTKKGGKLVAVSKNRLSLAEDIRNYCKSDFAEEMRKHSHHRKIHCEGKEKCYSKLLTMHNTIKVCLPCQQDTNGHDNTISLSDEMISRIQPWLKERDKD